MLQKVNIPISFAQGLDLKSDPKQVAPGQFLTLQNAIFTTPGELRKRNGYTAFSQTTLTGGTISSGVALATFNNELLEFDGSFLYTYDTANTTWVDKGRIVGMQITQASVEKNADNLTSATMTQHSSGLQLFTWGDAGPAQVGLFYMLKDSVTGATIVPATALTFTEGLVKAFALGNFIVIFYTQGFSPGINLYMISIPIATPLLPSAPTMVYTGNVFFWDGTLLSGTLYISIANGTVTTFTVSPTLVVGTPVVEASSAAVSVSIVPDPTLLQLWVSYAENPTGSYVVYSNTLTLISGPTVFGTSTDMGRIIASVNNGAGEFWWENDTTPNSDIFISTNTGTNTGITGTAAVFLRSVSLAVKPFVVSGITYFVINFDTPQQPTYFIVDQFGVILGKILPLAGGPRTPFLLGESVQLIPGLVQFTSLQVDEFDVDSTGRILTQTGVVHTTVDFNSTDTFYRASIAATLQISNGILKAYDGVNLVETGFNVYPELVMAVGSGSGGNLGSATVATQYQYSVTYTWYDNNGQVNNSFPSIPDANTTVNFAAGDVTGSVTLTIPTLRLTDKTNVLINVFRTAGNGTIFYQLTNHPFGRILLNDPTVDSVTFVDTVADSAIESFPILYTTGNVVGNDAPPAPKLITQYINRLMLVPSENPLQIWFSEEAVPGTALNFSALFTLNVDARGGPITALQQMDTELIIFKANQIFYITGQGPDNTGAQNDYGNAILITTDSGCENAHSIVQTPVGIMYQTPKGIYLLARNLQPEYIGAPVEAFNSYHITSADLIPTTNQVRFTIETQATTLVYDYFLKQWSVFTNQDAQDSTLFDNQFTYVQPNGLVMIETPGTFTDNGAFIPLVLTTSWLSMAQLQGFQRAYRTLILGEYKSAHTLSVGIAYDFDPTVVQTDLIVTTPDLPYEWRVDMRRQLCTSLQFTLQDMQTAPFGEGLSISGLSLMIGAKVGSNKVTNPRIYT